MKAKGWNKVAKFTYMQNIKGKSFIVSTVLVTVLIILMVLGINFLPPLFMGDDTSGIDSGVSNFENPVAPLSTVYYLDHSGLSTKLDTSYLSTLGVKVVEIADGDYDNYITKVYDSTDAEIVIRIDAVDYGYSILASRPFSTELIGSSVSNQAANIFASMLNNAKLISLGISAENIALANSSINTQVTVAGEAPKSELTEVIGMIVPMLTSLILFIFIFAYGQLVAQAIAMEKTSKIMELLLTSVKPLAVIIGKIIGIGLASFTQLLIMVGSTGLIFAVTAPFGFLGQIMDVAKASTAGMQMVSTELGEVFSHLNIMTVLWIIVLFILGFLFYALIAGLIGASISRLEDLSAAMQPLALIGVVGFYLAYMPSMFSLDADRANMMTIIARYIPISSPFSLPSAIILGQISTLETIMSVVILAVFDILMMLVVAKVYESIILHSGDRIKLKDIAKLIKTK